MRKIIYSLLTIAMAVITTNLVFGQASPFIYNGQYSKSLLPKIKLKEDVYITQGSTSPAVVAEDGPKGSLYLRTGGTNGELYIKNDSGSSTNWTSVLGTTTGWTITGNAGTTAGTNFLGTTDSVDLVFKTNGTERLRIPAAGGYDTTLGSGVVHSDSSGILSSSAVSLTADVSGILPVANGGTNLSSLGTANQILGVNSGASALEYKSLATGTSGTDFAISHGAGTVTFNLPVASASNTGKLSSSDFSTFSAKPDGSGTSGNVAIWSGTSTLSSEAQLALTRGGTNKSITAAAGGIAYTDADSFEINTPGTSGQLLTSGGTGAPTWTSKGNLTGNAILSFTGGTNAVLGSGASIDFANETANTVFAGPTTGSPATPTFRALVTADINGALSSAASDTQVLFMNGTAVTGDTGMTFNGTTNALTIGQIIAGGTTSAIYRTTNGGSNVTPITILDPGGAPSTGEAFTFDTSSQFGFTRSNGTRRIQRARIGLVDTTDTTNQEGGGLAFYTQASGSPSVAAAERMRITANGRVSIGNSSPAVSAALEVNSTTGAILNPRMTTAQRDALTAADGMQIYNTDNARPECRENGGWVGCGDKRLMGNSASVSSISASGTITISTVRVRQIIQVQGNAAAVTASVDPFGTTPPPDRTEIVVCGNSNTNTVKIVNDDTSSGALLNGDATLGDNDCLTVYYNSSKNRYVELTRNF